MTTLEKLEQYISSPARNKIVFCKNDMYDISFVDIGHNIASLLSDNNKCQLLSVFSDSQSSSVFGKYLAIENIGILFEPELKIDLHLLLERYSINKCLIIKSDGCVEDDTYYFIMGNNQCKISLSGLSFIEI